MTQSLKFGTLRDFLLERLPKNLGENVKWHTNSSYYPTIVVGPTLRGDKQGATYSESNSFTLYGANGSQNSRYISYTVNQRKIFTFEDLVKIATPTSPNRAPKRFADFGWTETVSLGDRDCFNEDPIAEYTANFGLAGHSFGTMEQLTKPRKDIFLSSFNMANNPEMYFTLERKSNKPSDIVNIEKIGKNVDDPQKVLEGLIELWTTGA